MQTRMVTGSQKTSLPPHPWPGKAEEETLQGLKRFCCSSCIMFTNRTEGNRKPKKLLRKRPDRIIAKQWQIAKQQSLCTKHSSKTLAWTNLLNSVTYNQVSPWVSKNVHNPWWHLFLHSLNRGWLEWLSWRRIWREQWCAFLTRSSKWPCLLPAHSQEPLIHRGNKPKPAHFILGERG